jgi:hypothetical protein
MGRPARGTLGALLALALILATAASAPGADRTRGSERFDGALVVSGASGKRTVVGSVVAMSGVFKGVGRIVERANRPGDSDKVSRDDLVFAAGTLHIVNVMGRASFAANPQTCTVRIKAQQRTTIAGGSGRFAAATGTFSGTVTGFGVARRKADGSCDLKNAGLGELDTVTGTGTLMF